MSPPYTAIIPSAVVSHFPPKLPISTLLPPQYNRSSAEPNHSMSRRNFAVLLSSILTPLVLPLLAPPPPASASSFGISGPKEWLKEQKKKSAKFLLAPVDASRNILQSAFILLTKSESEFGGSDWEDIQKMLKSAARDCIPQDRNSFVEFQANTGVEVCTFRLIVKNAASLLDDKDPVKLEAETKLSELIRSFAALNGMVREYDIQATSNSRQGVAVALQGTISFLNDFEQSIKNCLEV